MTAPSAEKQRGSPRANDPDTGKRRTTDEAGRSAFILSPGTTKRGELSRVRLDVGVYLSFRAVASQVLSAQVSLTSVFGMGTGGPSPLSTPTMSQLSLQHPDCITFSLFCQVFLSTGCILMYTSCRDGTPSGTRTLDTLIKSQVLYQLS